MVDAPVIGNYWWLDAGGDEKIMGSDPSFLSRSKWVGINLLSSTCRIISVAARQAIEPWAGDGNNTAMIWPLLASRPHAVHLEASSSVHEYDFAPPDQTGVDHPDVFSVLFCKVCQIYQSLYLNIFILSSVWIKCNFVCSPMFSSSLRQITWSARKIHL